MNSILDTSALILCLTALFSWLNVRFVALPQSTALLIIGLLASLILILVDHLFPAEQLHAQIAKAVTQVDFTGLVMNGMLGFLLFAGALEADVSELRSRALPIALLALAGTLVSAAIVGFGFWGVTSLLGHAVPLAWCLVFGALISPTDPVAVIATLRAVAIPKPLENELKGEALFNDGIGIVLFTGLLAYATATANAGSTGIMLRFVQEAGGGVVLGVATGYVAFLAIRAIDDFVVEVLITLALVAGTYAISQRLGTSGPLAIVAAGLLIGEIGFRDAMSDRTKRYVNGLWTLIDRILNAVLFFLLGLEVLVLSDRPLDPILAFSAPVLALLARLVAVTLPLAVMWRSLSARNIPFLTWAGIRGGISVALALSLPESPGRAVILMATYAVVLFTILVQASTLSWVARRTLPDTSGPGERRRHSQASAADTTS